MKKYECVLRPSHEKIIVEAHGLPEAAMVIHEKAIEKEWESVEIVCSEDSETQVSPPSGDILGEFPQALWSEKHEEYGVFDRKDIRIMIDNRMSRPQKKGDGSVSSYENLAESNFSDREILIAQLNELRTIKRCVVSVILIVIIIPTILTLLYFLL